MKKTIFLACTFLMLITACNDKEFFTLQRPIESPWQTFSEFERAPIGAYAGLFSKADWGNPYNYWYLYKNAVGDDAAWTTPGDNGWGWYRDTENNKEWVDDTFISCYRVISSINDALQYAEADPAGPYPGLSTDDKTLNFDRIVGELYFMRGFAYYMLATQNVTAYVPGGANDTRQIPLRVVKASSYQDASAPKIGTVQEIWDHILADFQKSYDLLPQRYIEGKMHPSYQAGRANKFAAAAMLARTYFAMGNYPKAKENASYVIDENGGDYDMSQDPIEAFNRSDLSRGKETIMYIPCYDPVFGHQNLHATCYSHLFAQFGPCDWTATYMDPGVVKRIGWMNEKTDSTILTAARIDKRFQQLIYVREPANVTIPGHYSDLRSNMLWRSVVANKSYRGPDPGYTNVPQIRLAEMYLTRSICSFKDGDKNGATSDLNIVRKRAWDANVAGMVYEASTHFVTPANITEQIIGDERLIEMFMEGDRIDYLRGLKVDVGNGDRGPGSVPYTDKGFVWPVPLVERNLDESYKQ